MLTPRRSRRLTLCNGLLAGDTRTLEQASGGTRSFDTLGHLDFSSPIYLVVKILPLPGEESVHHEFG